MNGEGLTFQQRLVLTVLLCTGVVLMWPYIFPPPELPETAGETEGGSGTGGTDGTGDAESGDGSADGASGGTDAEDGPEGVDDSPPGDPSHDVINHRLDNGEVALVLTNDARGLLAHAEGLNEQFRSVEGEPIDFLMLGEEPSLTTSFGETASYPLGGGREVVAKDDASFEVRYRTEGDLQIRERLELGQGFESRLVVTVKNVGDAPARHRFRLRQTLGEPEEANRYDLHRALCRAGSVVRWDVGDVTDEVGKEDGPVQWAGVDTNFFLQAVVPEGFEGTRCEISTNDDQDVLYNAIVAEERVLAPGESREYELGLYLGAKFEDRLADYSVVADANLDEAIYWGFFGPVSAALGRPMLALLRWFHQLTGIWGVSIIFLTLLVKGILFPLTIRQMRSMRKMREIQPEIEEIRKKYGDDAQKQQQELQALWARAGANPMSGCFPIFLQFPVFIALYASLQAAVELYHQPFLWLPDLTAQDPYYILPVALGGMMLVNSFLQPTPADNEQAKMMKWMMPIMFASFMLFLPSGLAVYIFANTTIGVVQSLVMLRPRNTEAAAPS